MSNFKKYHMYDIDENGKFIIEPLDIAQMHRELGIARPQSNVLTKAGSGRKSNATNRLVPQRLVLSPSELDDSTRVLKKRKVEKPVRKELFKRTQGNQPKRTSFTTRQSLIAKPKLVLQKQKMLNNKSPPLLNIEEAEQALLNKKQITGYPFKSPTVPKIEFNKLESKQADTPGSTEEFLELEKLCIQSPTPSISNNISENTKEDKENYVNQCMDQIKNILQRDKDDFEIYKRKRDENLSEIYAILTTLQSLNSGNSTEEVEKTTTTRNRRSLRLSSNKDNPSKKLFVSPGIAKTTDLRKSTLRKNLSKTVVDMGSPKVRKALNMYNSFRNEHSFLCTPKLERNVSSPKSSNINRSLSRKLERQCLMLQDTPSHI